MKLFNRGRRTINGNTKHEHKPGSWIEVPDEDGKKLLKLFPRDLTTNAAAEAAEAAAKEEREKLLKENEELKARLAEYEAKLNNLEKVALTPETGVEIPGIPGIPQNVIKNKKR